MPMEGPAGWIGPWLAKVRLHVVEPCSEPGAPRIAKRRRWVGRRLMGPQNACLRCLGAGVRVLFDREWWERERAVHRSLYGADCEVDARGRLILPRWPGVVLSEYGRDARARLGDRIRGVSAAALALRELHRAVLPASSEPFSHGDATVRNVMYDPTDGRARWFDFDMVHEPAVSPVMRRAEDLRALLFSALEHLADAPAQDLFESVHAAYDDPDVWDVLRDRLARGRLHHGVYHMAQACPPPGRRRELERILRRPG